MQLAERIESMLVDLDYPYEKIGESTWVITDEAAHVRNIVVYLTESLLNFRVKLMEIPANANPAGFRTLLEYNVTQMVHCAYGVEGDNVVITGTLTSENLDANEVAAMFTAISLAISTHYPALHDIFSTAD